MSFTIESLDIPEVCLIHPVVLADNRGYFFESYHKKKLDLALNGVQFVQDNESKSERGVLRGLHFQKGEASQAKLVRVAQGKIWDVAVDMRVGSPTFAKYVAQELSDENHNQLFIPKGFAHGFIVLSASAVVQYKADTFYSAESDGGVHPYDETINVDWPIPNHEHLLSSKDSTLPRLSAAYKFTYEVI